MPSDKKATLLIIAGSDSGGGAGIQADIKTASAFDVFATTAITAITAQNTQGVFGISEVPPEFISQQIETVLYDIGTDAIKTGMLHNSATIHAVVDSITSATINVPLGSISIVVDPVMVAKGGSSLLQAEAIKALKEHLLPLATLVTPNIPEAEILALADKPIRTLGDMEAAAKKILTMGPKAVLLKGGHLDSEEITDVLATSKGVKIYKNQRINTKHTHGTGCTLASAIAANLALGKTLEEAIEIARKYVQEAIKTAPGLGKGHGPLNHNVAVS